MRLQHGSTFRFLNGFFTRLDAPGAAPGAWETGPGILETVERVIQSRKVERPEGSYVARLLAKGDPGVRVPYSL